MRIFLAVNTLAIGTAALFIVLAVDPFGGQTADWERLPFPVDRVIASDGSGCRLDPPLQDRAEIQEALQAAREGRLCPSRTDE